MERGGVCPEGYYSITSLTVMAHKQYNIQEFFHKIQLVVNINSCNLQINKHFAHTHHLYHVKV